MIERYTLPRMKRLWSEETKFQTWLCVELFALEAWAELGKISKDALERIKKKANFDIKRIEEIEREVKHDLLAFLTNISENVGEDGRYIHFGMTSSDVVDTSLSFLMKQAGEIIIEDLEELKEVLRVKSLEYKKTVMVGRTHGMHAEPITLGLKFLLWYKETERNIERMKKAVDGISFGKISGAVGTFAHLEPFVEKFVCEKLSLKLAPVSSQILQRDRHAEYLTTIALIGSSIEKFSTEIRHLQRTEIGEVEEAFGKGQKGSSAMPHKKNPVTCERLCGLARILRGNSISALEDNCLWHERDISHSSVERIIIPDSTTILDYMVVTFKDILENLVVHPERMKKNLERNSTVFSQKVLLTLTEKGLEREHAYSIIQKHALLSEEGNSDFKTSILLDPEVNSFLTKEEIENCFRIEPYLEKLDLIYERAV